jgi:hypothetical protein
MLWKMMASAALAVAAVSAGPPAAAQGTVQAGPTAAQLAEALQYMVGKTDEDGFLIQSITSQGNLLIIVFSGPDGWSAGLGAQDISNALLTGFCGEAPDFFATGIALRVDSVDGPTRLPGPVITACPTPAA